MTAALEYITSCVRGEQEEEDEEELVISGPSGSRPADKTPLANSAQLALEFLKDPAAVLGEGHYAMTTSSDFLDEAITQTAQLPANEQGGPDYYLIEQTSNATVGFYAEHPSYPQVRRIEVEEAEKEGAPKMCFLPWHDSKLTYCKLENDAHLVLTGPLNGCSVFVVEVAVGEDGKETYLFHVNANSSGSGSYSEAQRAKFDAALVRLWPDRKRTLTQQLKFTDYGPRQKGMEAEAVVYGTRRNDDWRFSYYVIDINNKECKLRDGTPSPLPAGSAK
ncbi:hypothetical protein GCM10027176_27690 [Actinoallomurus bryophytorum]